MIRLRSFLLAMLGYHIDAMLQPNNYDRRFSLAYCGFIAALFSLVLNEGQLNRVSAFTLGLGVAGFFEVMLHEQHEKAMQDFNAGFN